MNTQEQEKNNPEDANAPITLITENHTLIVPPSSVVSETVTPKEYPTDVRVLIGDDGGMKIFDFEKLGSFACHPSTLYKAFSEWNEGEGRVANNF
jgi:hypothetical protein